MTALVAYLTVTCRLPRRVLERVLEQRPAVIACKVSHRSKNERGAEAFAAFTSLARTAAKKGSVTVIDTFHLLLRPVPSLDST